MNRWAIVIATVVVGVVGGAPPQAIGAPTPDIASPPLPAAPSDGMERYIDPVNGWSISYPVGWVVDGSDPARVQIHDPQNLAVVGIRVMPADLPLPAFATKMVGSALVRSREVAVLPNGTPAVDIRAETGPDARVHGLYVIAGGKAFAIEGQASVAAWPNFTADFETILNSFLPPASQ